MRITKFSHAHKAAFIAALLLVGSLHLQASPSDCPQPVAYDTTQAWLKQGALRVYPWPKEVPVDLRSDGESEVLLGISGYSRGLTYALFTKSKSGWTLLSEKIKGSNHPIEVLPAKHHGWSDFKTLLPSGRGGLIEFVYTWDGHHYIEKSEQEISAPAPAASPASESAQKSPRKMSYSDMYDE